MTILSALCIAAAIYGEARDQPVDGQIAIADVINTRVDSPLYPNDACRVVFARRQFAPATEFHNPAALARALSIAIAGESLGIDATHFHSGPPPYWADTFTLVGTIADHTFYMETPR